jgi:hypothetical protein
MRLVCFLSFMEAVQRAVPARAAARRTALLTRRSYPAFTMRLLWGDKPLRAARDYLRVSRTAPRGGETKKKNP